MQRLGWRLCHLKPAEILKMTIGELDIVLEEGYNEFEEAVKRHVDLKVSILNAPHFQKKGGNCYTMENFLPKSMIPKKEQIKPEEQARRTMEAGRRLAAKCETYTKRR